MKYFKYFTRIYSFIEPREYIIIAHKRGKLLILSTQNEIMMTKPDQLMSDTFSVGFVLAVS